ncbi:hypothetical protein GCM10020000_87820 [Streptomyces olivoverticillatus]
MTYGRAHAGKADAGRTEGLKPARTPGITTVHSSRTRVGNAGDPRTQGTQHSASTWENTPPRTQRPKANRDKSPPLGPRRTQGSLSSGPDTTTAPNPPPWRRDAVRLGERTPIAA